MEIDQPYLENIAQQLARLDSIEAEQVAKRAVELVLENHNYSYACSFREAIDVQVEYGE